jgi:chitinase
VFVCFLCTMFGFALTMHSLITRLFSLYCVFLFPYRYNSGPRNWNVEVPEDAGYAPQFNDNNGFNDQEGEEWNYVGDKYVNVFGGDDGNIYCHRTTPSGPRECNGHYYDKGLIGRAHSQGASVYISIGGWTISTMFPTLAASAPARRTFAKNCVGLIREYGIDGIDIQWEFPGYTVNDGTEDDAKNFVLLLRDVRSALDAYQKVAYPNNEKTIGLTAALPCIPEMIAYQDIEGLNEVLTELSLKSFDFHGVWNDKVGVNSPLLDQPPEKFDSPGMSVHGCTERWVEGGADISKINIGVPFFGRTFAGADRLFGPHGGSDPNWKEYGGLAQYHEILDKMLGMISLRDDVTKTQYAYFEDGGLVSFDDNQSICDKVEYSMEKNIHGLFVWDLSGDLTETYSTPLLDMVNLKLERGKELDCELFRAETRDKDGNVVAPADAEPNPWYGKL